MAATSTPSAHSEVKSDMILIGIICSIWLIPWFLITWAAKLAGGNPTYSPFDVFNFGRMSSIYNADGHNIVWWHYVGAFGPIHAWMFWAVLISILIIVGLGIAGWMLYWEGGVPALGASKFFAPRNLKRASRWANVNDLRKLRVRTPRPGAFILGRRGTSLIATEKETSVLVIGPTRSGKTTGLVIPNLFEWDGPAIVTSTKSELVDITGAYRQSVGPVYVYDPTGEISEQYQSVTWSPIVGCENLDYAIMVAAWLCAGLNQGNSGKSDNDWAHWAESGKLLIAPLLYCAATTGQHNIVDVRTWIHAFDLNTPMAIMQDLLSREAHPENSDPERAIGMLMSIDQRPEKERGTVFSTVMRIFSVFNEKPVALSAMTSRFNPEEFLKRKGTLYLCTPRQAPERVASLFVGILMTAVTKAYGMANFMPRGRLEPELGLFLDELANVVPIDELPSMASQGAGRGVILMSIVQDFSQLRARYGNDKSNSILNNHGCKIVLPGISDPETTEIIAKMVGRAEYTDVQIGNNDGKSSRTYSLRQDQMATPDALRQLQDGTGIVLYRGKPPTIVKLRPWFLERRFVEFSRRRFFKNADYVSYREAS
jgi:type IV secretion system protein VirD4